MRGEPDLPTVFELDGLARDRTAAADDAALANDPEVPNVVVAGASTDASRDDGAYVGADPAAAAGLAAAVKAVDAAGAEREDGSPTVGDDDAPAACLHYPDPVTTAAGPWLVVEPLGGRVATVHAGRGRVSLRLSDDATAAESHATVRRVLNAAVPDHPHYDLAGDDLGVFTSGAEVAELRRVTPRARGGLRAELAVRVTPATTASAVVDRFEAVEGVERARFDIEAGVERADPGDRLRTAVESSHVDARGDCEYEWGTEPSVFSQVPATEKVGLGAVGPGADRVDADAVGETADLLAGTLAAWNEGEVDR